MDISLKGWKVIHPGESGLVTVTVPGTCLWLTVNEAAALLVHVADRVNGEVRSLAANNSSGNQDDAGWAFRKARPANGFSNHVSGSAIDPRNILTGDARRPHGPLPACARALNA